MDNRRIRHTPTQDEIRQRCLEIQSEWTEYERYRRDVRRNRGEWHVPGENTASVTAIDPGWYAGSSDIE